MEDNYPFNPLLACAGLPPLPTFNSNPFTQDNFFLNGSFVKVDFLTGFKLSGLSKHSLTADFVTQFEFDDSLWRNDLDNFLRELELEFTKGLKDDSFSLIPYVEDEIFDIMIVDPFEVRMRFTQQLQHLSASVTSSQKAAQYALKFRDLDEDLHSCILEQLERNNMNIRANIMSFIEQFCEMATKEGHLPYVRMMQRDILRVVDAVVPPDGSGAANVKHVRHVLGNLKEKSILSAETVTEIDAALKDRDTHPAHYDNNEAGVAEESAQSHGTRLDKRQIEQRIEEDRERNKRLRESMWTVSGDDQDEWQQTWDETSDINSDDNRSHEEETTEQEQAAAAMRGEL